MIYWIWLQSVLRFANGRVSAILDRFSNAENIYRADTDELVGSGLFTEPEIKRAQNKSLSVFENYIKYCKENGIRIITHDSQLFPDCLINIPDSPLVLYCKGDLPDFNTVPSVCIVGPRKCSQFGIKAAYSLSARLARGGFVIVSGGAKGVDAAAHTGALSEGRPTVALLACGFGYDYLKENENLREDIMHCGCLITEFPPQYPVVKGAFRIRNRLMSALSLGTVVIEAGEHSGAIITAKYAVEQNKDVFVIPGNPADPQYAGSNLLLRDGAKPLLSAMDVFDEYIGLYYDKLDIENLFSKPLKPFSQERIRQTDTAPDPAPAAAKSQSISGVSDIAKAFYESTPDREFCIDELPVFNDYDATELIAAVAELELFGYVTAVPGGRYLRIK